MNSFFDTVAGGPDLFGITNPSSYIRLLLSIVVVGIAVMGGRRLADLASRVPSYRLHASRQVKAEAVEEVGVGKLLGIVTFVCVGLVAVVVIFLVWSSDETLATLVRSKTLGPDLASLALRIGASLLVFACMLGFGRLFERIIEVQLIHSHMSRNLVLLAGRLAYISSLVIGGIVVLALWSASIVLPVALVGALTVALTLALQDVLRNLVSGVYLLLEHPFVIGDQISVASYTGRVEDIQIRYTALRTENNERVLIPNSMLFTSAVVNLSAYDVSRGVVLLTVPEAQEDGIEASEEEIRDILKSIVEIKRDPPPQIVVSGAGAGKLQLQVIFWLPTSEPGQVEDLYSRVIAQLHAQVKEAEVARLPAAIGQ
jgi:small-conductance mechanosensitive channel